MPKQTSTQSQVCGLSVLPVPLHICNCMSRRKYSAVPPFISCNNELTAIKSRSPFYTVCVYNAEQNDATDVGAERTDLCQQLVYSAGVFRSIPVYL